nr:MAG TPA: hypothetical protein [Caudoviricetes sp.]
MISKQYNFIINISYTSPPFIYYIHSVRSSGYFSKGYNQFSFYI